MISYMLGSVQMCSKLVGLLYIVELPDISVAEVAQLDGIISEVWKARYHDVVFYWK